MKLLDTRVVDIRGNSVAIYAEVLDPASGAVFGAGVEVEADDNDGVSYLIRVQHVSWKGDVSPAVSVEVLKFLETDYEVEKLLIDTANEPVGIGHGWRSAS